MKLPFLAKIGSAGNDPVELTSSDKALLEKACSDVRRFPARRDIVREGDPADRVHLVMEGWACRYKLMRDGGRQITAILLPGDFCDAHITLFGQMDHSIKALSACKVAIVDGDTMRDLLDRPALARALWWASLVDEAVLRAWIGNIGRRDGFDRLGHLLCELHARLQNVGLVDERSFSFPVTQEELADSLGLTAVHVNRMLKRLRDQGLLTLQGGKMTIDDIAHLQDVVGFDANYLHLPRQSRPYRPFREDDGSAAEG